MQRLVYFEEGLAASEQSLLRRASQEELDVVRKSEELCKERGIFFSVAGTATPIDSLTRDFGERPWSGCRRPYTLTYIPSSGNVLSCCFAPFGHKSAREYMCFYLCDFSRKVSEAMPDSREIDKMRVVYELPGMEHIPVKKDIVYKTVANEDLTMDIYYPFNMQPDALLPAVIFVQGGSQPERVKRSKEMQQYVSWSQLIAASGLIAVVFEHRSDEGYRNLSAVGDDVADLFHYVRGNSVALGINPDFLGIWSCSSGSLYGLSAALRGTPEYVRCAIAYYGGMTLLNRELFHFSPEEEEGAREFSPIYHLSWEDAAKIAPLFIVKAGRDRAFLNEALDEFVSMANERNVPITFMNHPEGEHGFDILHNDVRSREIIRATLGFIHEHLRVG